jgi:hypothetical protein
LEIQRQFRKVNKTILASFDDHRLQPHFRIKEHIQTRSQELANSLANKVAIYLDLRFWITDRDAVAAKPPNPTDQSLADQLLQSVSTRRFWV